MTFPLLSWHIPFNSSQKSKQGTHKKEASGPSGISSQETHIKKKQKERKKERLNVNQQQHRTLQSSMKVVFQVVGFLPL